MKMVGPIPNEKGLINKSFEICSFELSFHWNVQYHSVFNKSIASKLPFVLFDSYIEKLPHQLLAVQIRHGNNGDLWCHAACHGYVAICLLNGLSATFNQLKNRYSQYRWNKWTSFKCFSPQFIHLTCQMSMTKFNYNIQFEFFRGYMQHAHTFIGQTQFKID